MKTIGVFAATVALWAVAGCEGNLTARDSGIGDATIVLDGGCVVIGQNCNQLGDCAKGCGTNETCDDDCASAGCNSARTAFANVKDCTIPNCWTSCTGGFNDDCMACSQEKCPAENATCLVDECPKVCNTGTDGGADAALADRSVDAGASLTCSGIYDCLGGCLAETQLFCIDPCRGRGCAAAQTAIDSVLDCADTSCKVVTGDNRCFMRYSTADCLACIQERCATQWTVCSAVVCP
jgi:hypothetical protein